MELAGLGMSTYKKEILIECLEVKQMTTIENYNKEISTEIAKPEIQRALLATTFKGLELNNAKRAMLEGMMRGFTFKDFLEKNVYAVPYGQSYSLVTSIDYARKIAMKSGLAGKSAPVYTFDKDGKLETCTVSVKRNVDGYVGEYTATVYFNEYSTGKNLWATKPKTMIAKVAEMHALRAGFPEEMAKQYVDEEIQSEKVALEPPKIDLDEIKSLITATATEKDLNAVWLKLSPEARNNKELKDLYITHKKKINETV